MGRLTGVVCSVGRWVASCYYMNFRRALVVHKKVRGRLVGSTVGRLGEGG